MTDLTFLPAAAPLAPTGRLIDAVLQFADLHEDLGDGRMRLRLSRKRAREPEVRAALGADARRAAEVAVVYDEREAEVVDVAGSPRTTEPDAFEQAFLWWNSESHRRHRRDLQGRRAW